MQRVRGVYVVSVWMEMQSDGNVPLLRPLSAPVASSMAVAVVGGLLIAVIVALVIFVLLRRRRIRRKRTTRRLLQEREVGLLRRCGL